MDENRSGSAKKAGESVVSKDFIRTFAGRFFIFIEAV